jgi:uncharacterized protein (DUF1015 family)
MAEIALLRGLLYDPAKVQIDRVIAPPYDVISEDERAKLEALDPHNIVRLILPRGEGDERYAGAARTLAAWRDEGVLKRDTRPAIYRYSQTFTIPEVPGRRFTRRGFICAVRLHTYDEKVILPHERTLRGPKEDRLKLMRATRSHFSQIFGLYRDPSMRTDQAFSGIDHRPPDLEGKTADGTLHEVWRVNDRETIASVGKAVGPLPIYIADGHHRYETMLALRDELKAAAPEGSVGYRSSIEFATFFLTNMADPGLVVLPTHRLVHSLASFDKAAFLARVAENFAVETVAGGAGDVKKLKTELHTRSQQKPCFAAVFPGDSDAYLLVLQTDPYLPMHRSVATLDVTLLHGVVIERVLGVDREAQEQQSNIAYIKDTAEALARVARGEAQVGFIMNPTRVDQVLDAADHGQTMPQKSTFFVPKLASGLVLNPLSVDEDLDKAW